MKIIAYTPLLYGKEYLKWAVQSVADQVQRHIILYSPKPSYGYGTDLPCPETEDELRECVGEFSHVEWYEVDAHNESQHRAQIWKHVRGEDILLPIDADEVWHPVALQACLKTVYDTRRASEYRLGGMIHFWRSFSWSCQDQMMPVRFIDRRGNGSHEAIYGRLYHFGYAQSPEIVKYKWAIHGHFPEMRENWLEEKFVNWEPGIDDVHPTCKGVWNPRPFKKEKLPLFLRFHPHYEKEVIE